MKRLFSLIFSFALVFILPFNVLAITNSNESTIQTSVEYFDDGSYITTTITEEQSYYSTYATTTKNGSKTTTYTGSDDEVKWSATLHGTFTYTGSSSTCTSSSITYSSSDSDWRITSATSSKSGNKAIGDVTAKQYVLGIPLKTVNETITLTCSATGTLS